MSAVPPDDAASGETGSPTGVERERTGSTTSADEPLRAGSHHEGVDTDPPPAAPAPDRSAARQSGIAAIVAGLLALGLVGPTSLVAFSLSAIGTAVVVGGVIASYRGLVTAGASVLFVGVLAAGVVGVSALRLLVATGGVLFAWDVGRYAIDVGAQLGTAADTTAIERRHAGRSAAVIALTGGVGYVVFRTVSGSQPVVGVVALLIAGALLTLVLE